MPKPSLLDIILPSKCAVCEMPGPNLCQVCEQGIKANPHRFQRGDLTGLAATNYSPEVSKLVVGFKEHGQFALAKQIGLLMHPLAAELSRLELPIELVPAPSRSKNFSKRGFTPSLLLAQQISSRLQGSKVLNCLVLAEQVKDQVGLSRIEREVNLQGSIRVNQPVNGRIVVLVDDVVTTGATLRESKKALTLAGAYVIEALVLTEGGRAEDAKSPRRV